MNGTMWKKLDLHETLQDRRKFLFRVLVIAAVIPGVPWDHAAADIIPQAATNNTPLAFTKHSNAEDELTFESTAHRAWYDVFWTGECGKLPWLEQFLCVEGRPTWTEVTQMVVDKATPKMQTTIRDKMIRLGRMIGHEWARDNDERRINSDDLILWYDWLKNNADANDAVKRLSKAAQNKVGQQ